VTDITDTGKLTIQNRERLNRHGDDIRDLKADVDVLLKIDRKLDEKFFSRFEELYKYIVIGNGESSLKHWRREVDNERQVHALKEKNRENAETLRQNEVKAERRKWIDRILLFVLGMGTDYARRLLGL
jgi:hypothetical protein